jgi:hypothetical protein
MQAAKRNRKTRYIIRRLLHMELPEIACRSRQEALKWAERVRATTDLNIRRGWKRTVDRDDIGRFVRNAAESFFPGPLDGRVPAALAIAAPDHCKEVIAFADSICRGTFELLGYKNLDFGNPLDWHLDPVSGNRAPAVHWTRIDPLDYAAVGDSKVTWELNRHQWFVTLGQAYRLTRDERYARAIIHFWQSWLQENPVGIGMNWTSSLEVAFRIISWTWTILLINDSDALTPEFFAAILESVEAHASHVERYLSYYFAPNTHLTGEALGLLYAGVAFPQLKRAERLRSIGARILIQEIERQVVPDGVYFERSTCYQRYTVDFYLHFLDIASRVGIDVPRVASNRLRSMLDFLIAIRKPDGSMPDIGDGDGGWLLPLSRSEPLDFRGTFSTAAVLFRSPEYAWAAGELAPETVWLLGNAAIESFQAIQPALPASSECRMFRAGGFGVMRNGWDAKSHWLLFDAGPLGCDISGGHGHADLLSIQLSAFGQQFLVDGGTCCYTADRELRDFSRGTTAHSTIVVDGKFQAEPAGPFSWRNRSTAHLRRWISDNTITFADAEHDGYGMLSEPVSHRRRVLFIKPMYWLIVDDVTGLGQHRVEIRFQFAPMKVRIDETGWVRATHDDRSGLLLRTFASVPMDLEVREGQRNPLEGWVSSNYGRLEPAPAIVYAATTQLPMRSVTLLWPAEAIDQTPDVDVIRDPSGRPIGLLVPEREESVLFCDGEPLVDRGTLTHGAGPEDRINRTTAWQVPNAHISL